MPTRVLGWPAFSPRTGNPYNALLSRALERRGARVYEFSPRRLLRGRYDVWHLHWPELLAGRSAALLRVVMFALLVLWAKARGTRIVWTVHNLEAHTPRHPGLERQMMRWLAGRLDGVVALSKTGARLAHERYPVLAKRPATVVSHGHYVGRYPNEVGQDAARLLLGLPRSARVIAFVGRILPYKNIERLVTELRGLEDPYTRLLVAGEPATPALRHAILQARGDDRRISLHLQDVADEELQVFLGAADLVVLPYERVLNSGSALLALSFGRPVLVPATGAMEDLRDQLGADAVRLYRGQLSAAHLAAALDRPAPDPVALLTRLCAEHDWDAIAERTLSLYAETAR